MMNVGNQTGKMTGQLKLIYEYVNFMYIKLLFFSDIMLWHNVVEKYKTFLTVKKNYFFLIFFFNDIVS